MLRQSAPSSSINKDNNNHLANAINKTEIKILDNNSDRKFSTDIDHLNESLYKINSFLKLSKDIDELKRENSVKNDIQRKLSLKSQWLSQPHGSTTSLNSLPNFDMKSTASGSSEHIASRRGDKENIDADMKSLSNSIQSLDACTAAGNTVAQRRANFLNNKAASIQNLDGAAERRKRRLANKDELNFVHSLDLSDQDIEALSSEPEFGGPKVRFKSSSEKLNESMKKIELQSFADTMNAMQSQHTGPKVSTSGSLRDLSKFFPKKDGESPRASRVNLAQKELKDVDLSKYFAPSPVQERRSLPSPSQSPSLQRKAMAGDLKKPPTGIAKQVILREAITKSMTNVAPVVGLAKVVETPQPESKKHDFTMFDQQMDGAVTLRRPIKPKLLEPIKGAEAKVADDLFRDANVEQERSPSREYSQLFDNDKSTIDNIDELFDEVAAKLVPELPKLTAPTDDKKRKSEESDPIPSQNKKKIKSKPQKVTNTVAKKETKPKKDNTPIWCRKSIDEETRDAFILSKLSNNLIDEIKMLEQQLEITVNPDRYAKPTEKKKSTKKTAAPKPPERSKEKRTEKPAAKPAEKPSGKQQAVNKPVVKGNDTNKPNGQKRTDSGSLCGSDLDNAFEDIFNSVEVKAPPRRKSAKAKKALLEKEQAANLSQNVAGPSEASNEPKSKIRKNSISYEVPLSSPPRSRKNSATSMTSKPSMVDIDSRKTVDLHTAIVENLPHQVVLTKPPRSRKNSTAEAPPSPKIEEKRNSKKTAPSNAVPKPRPDSEEWNVNPLYITERGPVASKLDGGVDQVDHKPPQSPVLKYERPAFTDTAKKQSNSLKEAPLTPPTSPTAPTEKKMAPPKPIRRNKSSSSIDRQAHVEEDTVDRAISMNENLMHSRNGSNLSLIASNTNHVAATNGFSNNNHSHVRTEIHDEPVRMRELVRDRIPADIIRNHSDASDNFRRSGATERRGLNLSEWSKRRDIVDRYQVQPEAEDRPVTGYIPHDNLRDRHQYLSDVQADSRVSNDLTGLIESLQPRKLDASRRHHDHTANATSSQYSPPTARSNHHDSDTSEYDASSQNYYKYPSRGIYDNLPSDSAIPRPTDTDYYSAPQRRPLSNEYDYDNLVDRDPMPVRKASLHEYRPVDNTTDRLIERSKLIHNRKQEFMNEQIVGNNPYLKRILRRESRELPSSVGTYEPSYRAYEQPITDYRSSIANSKLSKAPSTFSLNKKRGSNKSLNSISSAKRSVLDLFKRSPEKPRDKDNGCAVS